MNQPVADIWYGVEPHAGGVTRLREAHIDPYWSSAIWILHGSRMDLVVDSGTGIVPPGPVIQSISGKPVLAVALCAYYDHAGGLYSFDERACHVDEASSLSEPACTWQNFLKADALRALPYPDFKLEDYRVRAAPPTRVYQDGDIIDLGDRRLEVLHIPGRTPGSIALWQEERGFLFGGESLFIDPERRDFPPTDVALYEQSLRRLSRLSIQTVFGGHYGSFSRADFERLVSDELGRYPS